MTILWHSTIVEIIYKFLRTRWWALTDLTDKNDKKLDSLYVTDAFDTLIKINSPQDIEI